MSIPVNDFAVVYDTERNMIIHADGYGKCVSDAENFNLIYQSTAYVAILWRDRA